MPQLQKMHFLHFVFIGISILALSATADQNVDPGDPLFLTPLIEGGEVSKAQEAALVGEFSPVVSYSGFITVNSTHNSNIFFWFFPAEGRQIDDNTAPVILWNDGGPGISGFFSIFGQNGPFTGSASGDSYTTNPFSWHKNYNMIFMDNPVEVGYSFTENENGYVTSGPEAARDIYEFLTQFFTLFPHLAKNPFYNGGASFGATYAIQSANYIHQQNLKNPKVSINLTGLIVDSPWIESYSQVHYADYLFNVGLISESSRNEIREKEDAIRGLLDEERCMDAFSVKLGTISYTRCIHFDGYGAINNIYNDQPPNIDMTKFATENSTRKAIHVGALEFRYINLEQQARMHPNMMRSSKPEMDALLQAGYRFLLYVGNMDCNTGHLGIQKLIKSLSWEGASDLINKPRSIWKENERVAGYNMTSSNMTFLIVRNAGHGCLLDQPEWVLKGVEKFLF